MPKYKIFKNEKTDFCDRTLYRIKALKDFTLINGKEIKAGDLGGFVESKKNLSQRGSCWIYGNAHVFDNAKVYDNAMVFDSAFVYGNARVHGNSCVCSNAGVCDNAKVYNNALVCGEAKVCYNALVCGEAVICGQAKIFNKACVRSSNDYICITGFGSHNRNTTFYKCEDESINVVCGCFDGTLDEFVAKVKQTHKDSKYAREYLTIVEAVKIHFNL